MQIKPEIGFTASNPGTVSLPDRQGKLSGKSKNATNVVAVFVGDENAGNVTGLAPEILESGHGFPQPEPTVQHQASRLTFDQQRITRAAAAE